VKKNVIFLAVTLLFASFHVVHVAHSKSAFKIWPKDVKKAAKSIKKTTQKAAKSVKKGVSKASKKAGRSIQKLFTPKAIITNRTKKIAYVFSTKSAAITKKISFTRINPGKTKLVTMGLQHYLYWSFSDVERKNLLEEGRTWFAFPITADEIMLQLLNTKGLYSVVKMVPGPEPSLLIYPKKSTGTATKRIQGKKTPYVKFDIANSRWWDYCP